jgi:tetratricopeptide (TPR) repeat protein
VVNVLIHALATLTLFGLVRRTLELARGRKAILGSETDRNVGEGVNATVAIPFCIALVWALHPLQTESVTFVIQRTESLAGLFYLLTLYCFVRGVTEPAKRLRWQTAAVVCCLAGMATKEVVATAPIVVWIFDRTFVTGGFRAAWRERRGFHIALGSTWALLAALMVSSVQRGGTVGFGLGVSSWEYLLTQCRALTLYLRLSVWPDPLVVDYGTAVDRRFEAVMPQFILLLTLGVAVAGAARRHPAVGFAAVWFLAILAPSSSFVPLTTQTIAEHRMYLPLVAIVGMVVIGLYRWIGGRGLLAIPVLALGLGLATAQRNNDYANSIRLWSDTVEHRPKNPRAHYNLANALASANRASDAVRHYETALQLNPTYGAAHFNLAGTLLQIGRETEAIEHYQAALRLEPGSADIHANLASAMIRAGRMPEAVAHYEKASQRGMLAAEEQLRFGRALAEVGRLDDAIFRLNEALRLNPKHSETHVVLGMVLSAAGHAAEGLSHLTEAVLTNPENAGARATLGDALIEANRPAEALLHYETALRLQPDHAPMLHTSMANALVRLGRVVDAIRHYEEALRLNPNDAEARANLSAVRAAAQKRGLLRE